MNNELWVAAKHAAICVITCIFAFYAIGPWFLCLVFANQANNIGLRTDLSNVLVELPVAWFIWSNANGTLNHPTRAAHLTFICDVLYSCAEQLRCPDFGYVLVWLVFVTQIVINALQNACAQAIVWYMYVSMKWWSLTKPYFLIVESDVCSTLAGQITQNAIGRAKKYYNGFAYLRKRAHCSMKRS